ncbi:MAG: hypothetical protein J6C11_03810 [Spirochaetaceae bacterium]|nr:hypothetical protein [Spirochaetaceae bacterium]MBP3673508.1 hypothetical protein [Oscillospiraceae bacterium]
MKYIATKDEAELFLKEAMKNIFTTTDENIEFDKQIFSIRLRLTGEVYNQSITSSTAKYIMDLQKALYSAYKIFTDKPLTKEDKERLEIVATIERGSTELFIQLAQQLEVIKEAVSHMTGDQLYSVIMTGIIGCTLTGLGRKAFDFFGKKHADELEAQKALAQTEKDRHIIDKMEELCTKMDDSRNHMIKSLASINKVETINLDGEVIEQEELLARVKTTTQKSEPETNVETGSYIINKISMEFNNKTGKADIYCVETEEVIIGMIIQTKNIIDGSFKMLKNAQNGEAVQLQIVTKRKDSQLKSAILDRVL